MGQTSGAAIWVFTHIVPLLCIDSGDKVAAKVDHQPSASTLA